MNIWCSAIIALCLFSLPALSEEVDDFSDPTVQVEDATDLVNNYTNQSLLNLVQNAARKRSPEEAKRCDPQWLENVLRDWMGNAFTSEIKTHIEQQQVSTSKAAKKIQLAGPINLVQTLYEGTNVKTCCVWRLKLNGVMVGLDKVDHFFATGKMLLRESGGLDEKALKLNHLYEQGAQGLLFTNVKSYADMAANWSGYLFWKQLLNQPESYFSCKDGEWTLVKRFDAREFVDSSWNESINCSSFTSEELRDHFFRNIAKAEKKQCPTQIDPCGELAKKYGAAAKGVLSPKCLAPEAGFSQVEERHYDLKRGLKLILGMSFQDIKGFLKKEAGILQ